MKKEVEEKVTSLVMVLTANFQSEEAMKLYFKTKLFDDLGTEIDVNYMELHSLITEDDQQNFFDYLMDESSEGYIKKIPFLIPEIQEDLEDEAISHVIMIYADKTEDINLPLFKLDDSKIIIDTLITFYCIEF